MWFNTEKNCQLICNKFKYVENINICTPLGFNQTIFRRRWSEKPNRKITNPIQVQRQNTICIRSDAWCVSYPSNPAAIACILQNPRKCVYGNACIGLHSTVFYIFLGIMSSVVPRGVTLMADPQRHALMTCLTYRIMPIQRNVDKIFDNSLHNFIDNVSGGIWGRCKNWNVYLCVREFVFY